jgi:hypothetical protein
MRDEVWDSLDAAHSRLESGELDLAAPLLHLARMSTGLKLSSKQWNGALASCNAAQAAVNVLVRKPFRKANQGTQLENTVRTIFTTQNLPGQAAYAAYRAQTPVHAVTIIESLAGLIHKMQINAAVVSIIQRGKWPVLRRIKGMATMNAQLHLFRRSGGSQRQTQPGWDHSSRSSQQLWRSSRFPPSATSTGCS